MENNTLVKMAAIVILAPIAVGTVIGVINIGIGVKNAIVKAKFNHKLKKGLEEGTIVEIDGKYYEADIDVIKEMLLNKKAVEEA